MIVETGDMEKISRRYRGDIKKISRGNQGRRTSEV